MRLEWTDVDLQRKTITLNQPEKNSNPRIFNATSKVIGMINALPRKKLKVFGNSTRNSLTGSFRRSRIRAARKLQNARLLKISFYTLRDWKATTLYHQTKDIVYVKNFLGHRSIENTMLYIQLAEAIFKETSDEFTVKIAQNPGEVKELLEVGFEYICEKDELMFFRKRK